MESGLGVHGLGLVEQSTPIPMVIGGSRIRSFSKFGLGDTWRFRGPNHNRPPVEIKLTHYPGKLSLENATQFVFNTDKAETLHTAEHETFGPFIGCDIKSVDT